MKRITAALALTAALTLGVTAHAQSQTDPVKPAELKDVPAGHWAQEAIKIAADCGLLRGFPDGTYRGQQPFTRYQAAVVIARLLNVIQNGQCGIGKPGTDGTMIDPAQLEALQNAVQELSADLAQLGVRVAELEDNAVTQDDLARVEDLATQARDLAEAASGTGGGVSPDDLARVEEIANEARDLAEAAATATGADPEALQNLTDQVEAASIAADTALAQARELQDKVDELSGRVDDLSGQVDELTATVEGQADSIAALNDLVVLLNQDVLSLQDRVAQLEAGQADLSTQLEGAATQEDLDALREFTTLLRRDQTALQDRVADLEARVTKNEGDIKALDARVTVLEANAFTISGTLSLKYTVSRTWFENGTGAAPDFDMDRLNIGFPSSGGSAPANARDFADFGNSQYPVNNSGVAATGQAYTIAGGSVGTPTTPTGNREGAVDANIGLSFTLKPRNLLSDPGNFPAGSITIGLKLDNGDDYYTNSQADTSKLAGIKLNLTGLSAAFKVGAAPAIVNFGVKPGFAFTKYSFNNAGGRGDGFVADIGGAGLPLDAALSVVYGSKSDEFSGPTQTLFSRSLTPNADPTKTGTYAAPVVTLNANVPKLTVTTGGRRGITRLDFDSTVRGRFVVYYDNNVSMTSPTFDSGTGQSWALRSDASAGNFSGGRSNTIVQIVFVPSRGITGANGDNAYFTGIKGTLSIIPGLTGGVYYAIEGGDVLTGTGPSTNYGLFGAGKLFGLIDLEGEHSISLKPASAAQNASYIKAGVTLGIFSVAGNYRFIESGFNPIGDDGNYPYKTNQSGFGVDVGLNNLFGFLTVSGYFDSRTKLGGTNLPNGPKQPTWGRPDTATGATDFGFAASISVIGFAIGGGFDSISETGNGWTTTAFNVTAKHDGSKPTALIKGFNLALGYYSESYAGDAGSIQYDPVTGTTKTFASPVSATGSQLSTLVAYADFTIGAAGSFQIIPAAWFTSASYNGANNTATGLGGKLTVNIPFLFGSTLGLAGAYDQTSYGAGSGALGGVAGTASTTWLKAGLSFPSFILPNSTFSVAVASRTDINRDGNAFGPSFASPDSVGASYFSPSSPWGRDGSARGGSLSGLYLGWSYYGLQFGYGIFNLVPFSGSSAGKSTWGQEFTIGYSLKF